MPGQVPISNGALVLVIPNETVAQRRRLGLPFHLGDTTALPRWRYDEARDQYTRAVVHTIDDRAIAQEIDPDAIVIYVQPIY